jgi:hypothetical protein
MNYAAFRALRQPFEDRADIASRELARFPSEGPMGLTPDHVKATPEFQAALKAWRMADANLREFDKGFTRTFRKTWPVYFKRELAEENKAKRAAMLAKRA